MSAEVLVGVVELGHPLSVPVQLAGYNLGGWVIIMNSMDFCTLHLFLFGEITSLGHVLEDNRKKI